MSTNHETRPSTPNTSEYSRPFQDDDHETQTPGKNNKKRNRLIGAVAAGVAAAVAGGVFLAGNNSSAERQPESRPTASAPANPGQNHEASPSPSETKEKPSGMTLEEAKTAFEQQMASDDEQIEAVTIDFEHSKNTKVGLNYLDALSDWTMAGTSKENYEAWDAWLKASMGPDVSLEESNSVPNAIDVSELIAGHVAEQYMESAPFENYEPDYIETIKDLNAQNIQLAFKAWRAQAQDPSVPAYEASLKPDVMTQAGPGRNTSIRFNVENNADADFTDIMTDDAGMAHNYLHVSFDYDAGIVETARIDQFQEPAPYMDIADQVAADDSTPTSR